MTRLFPFLGNLVNPSPSAAPQKSIGALSDPELREVAFKLAIALVDPLGPIVQESFKGRAIDDPSWHRPWPTTVEMFIRLVFMTSVDAFGTAAIGLGANASAASAGLIRTVAECHVLMRWVLDGATPDEQRARVLTITKEQLGRVGRALGHWERLATERLPDDAIARLHQVFDPAERELEVLARTHGLTIPARPQNTDLFDRYLPGGYFLFALLSNMGTHPGSPALFYGEPGSGVINWDFKGLDIDRSFWLSKGCQIQLANCLLAAPICGWTNHESHLEEIAGRIEPIAMQAEKRLARRRDPKETWGQDHSDPS